MKSDVESIQTEIRGLTDDGKKLQNAVSELNGMWEGEAKEAFMNAFQTDLNSLEDMTLDIAGQTYQLSFTDAEIDHYIVFSEPIPANSLIFTIDSVYSGKDADCCISEITPYAAG